MASADVIGGGNVEPRALEEEMRTAYLDYAMSVIVGRALPDVRDGLKPVHRRVLAAMAYTEARLARIATEMLRDLDMDTVDFTVNYDGSRQEPTVLPSRFPNLLVNGSSGIAVGMATNIPPHNLREVIGATIAYIEDPEIDLAGLMRHVKGPDFPTAGTILGRDGIRDAYATGRGRVRVQGKAHIEPIGQGKEAIIVTELPYQVRKGGDGGLIEKIRDLVLDKKIPEISDPRDESDRRGMR